MCSEGYRLKSVDFCLYYPICSPLRRHIVRMPIEVFREYSIWKLNVTHSPAKILSPT